MNISNNRIAGDNDWCVAGGYAACPTLASDMDVWVLGGAKHTREEILERLIARNVAFDEEENGPGDAYIRENEAGCQVVLCWKVARVYEEGRPDRHIIVTNTASIPVLLNTFDISTHQWARDSHNVTYSVPTTTRISEPPVVLRRTKSTAERLEKITARYLHLRKD